MPIFPREYPDYSETSNKLKKPKTDAETASDKKNCWLCATLFSFLLRLKGKSK